MGWRRTAAVQNPPGCKASDQSPSAAHEDEPTGGRPERVLNGRLEFAADAGVVPAPAHEPLQARRIGDTRVRIRTEDVVHIKQ